MNPILVRVRGTGWETVLEVDRQLYKDAASVARRLRAKGASAIQHMGEVIINANVPLLAK